MLVLRIIVWCCNQLEQIASDPFGLSRARSRSSFVQQTNVYRHKTSDIVWVCSHRSQPVVLKSLK